MKMRIKKLNENAVLPSYAMDGDAALDLTAVSIEDAGSKIICHTGIALEIPRGHVGLVFPRSSVHKMGLSLANSVGVIDSGYRGELTIIFNKIDLNGQHYSAGDRIGQIMILPYPHIEVEEADELSDTERGEGGLGSTGR